MAGPMALSVDRKHDQVINKSVLYVLQYSTLGHRTGTLPWANHP
jgi:hypothetical protein